MVKDLCFEGIIRGEIVWPRVQTHRVLGMIHVFPAGESDKTFGEDEQQEKTGPRPEWGTGLSTGAGIAPVLRNMRW